MMDDWRIGQRAAQRQVNEQGRRTLDAVQAGYDNAKGAHAPPSSVELDQAAADQRKRTTISALFVSAQEKSESAESYNAEARRLALQTAEYIREADALTQQADTDRQAALALNDLLNQEIAFRAGLGEDVNDKARPFNFTDLDKGA